jgi:hypothetical protein
MWATGDEMTGKIVLTFASTLICVCAFGAEETPTAVNWKAMLPAVQSVVRQQFPKETAQAHYTASIARTADITGRGRSEALVDLGSGGYTSEMTVMRMEGDAPVVARFVGRDGKVSPMVFQSGVSEGKGEVVEFRPQEHVVYSGHWMVNGAKLKQCRGEAYQWDASAKNFKFEKKLSKTMTREFCQKTGTKLQAVILPGE